MNRRRLWCFLVHRWWVATPWRRDAYYCARCGERWARP